MNLIPVLVVACLALQACLLAEGSGQEVVAILSPQNAVPQGSASATGALGSASPEPVYTAVGSGASSDVKAYSVGTNLTGTWSIYLSESEASRLDIALFQNRGVITGYGQMTYENFTQDVTAAGYVNGVGADLFISPIGGMRVYRLILVPSEKTIEGSYGAYSTSGTAWSGVATGSSPAVQEILAPAQAQSGDLTQSHVAAVNIGQGISSRTQAYSGGQTVSSGNKGVKVGSTESAPADSTYNPRTGGLTISKIVSSSFDGTGTTTTTSDGSHTTITYT